jgi:NAD(P)H-flavin reductase
VFDPQNVTIFLCGPEGMMHVVTKHMLAAGVHPCHLWLSMERNMQCAVGHCGHCQYGAKFICKDGPVFCYEQVAELFNVKGF